MCSASHSLVSGDGGTQVFVANRLGFCSWQGVQEFYIGILGFLNRILADDLIAAVPKSHRRNAPLLASVVGSSTIISARMPVGMLVWLAPVKITLSNSRSFA